MGSDALVLMGVGHNSVSNILKMSSLRLSYHRLRVGARWEVIVRTLGFPGLGTVDPVPLARHSACKHSLHPSDVCTVTVPSGHLSTSCQPLSHKIASMVKQRVTPGLLREALGHVEYSAFDIGDHSNICTPIMPAGE